MKRLFFGISSWPACSFHWKNFVEDVLERFEIQIHQLTPNAFAHLSIFAMATKMLGCKLLVDTFVRFYKTQQRRNKVLDPKSAQEVYSEFGAYDFVPKKTRRTTYRNVAAVD